MVDSELLLLDKIYYLGKRLESNRLYTLLDPWHFDCNDPLEVQKACKKISNFIGLQNLTFVITYTKQVEGVGGHIELNNNSEEGVFIEIDDNFKTNDRIVLAILAHEICHKLIHYYGLTQFGYENEILTDVATIYTGLGKLSLNGCENAKTYTESGTSAIASHKVGYLSRQQFAFVYKVLCRMRRIPEIYMLDHLCPDSLIALNDIYFNESNELFYNESSINLVSETIKRKLNKLQADFASNYKAQKTLRLFLDSAHELYFESHMKLKSVTAKLTETAKLHHDIESLNFIKNVILIRELECIDEKFTWEENEFSTLSHLFFNWINDLSAHKHAPAIFRSRDFLYSFECPICRYKMSLRQDKLVKVICTNCKYSFIIDNTDFKIIKDYHPKVSIRSKIREIISIIKS